MPNECRNLMKKPLVHVASLIRGLIIFGIQEPGGFESGSHIRIYEFRGSATTQPYPRARMFCVNVKTNIL